MPKRHKKRSLGTKSHKGIHKSKRLERFLAKGVDQCWEEFQAADGDPDGMRKPELDDDLPGQGRFYCAVTARHFETAAALERCAPRRCGRAGGRPAPPLASRGGD